MGLSYHQRRKKRLRKIESVCSNGDWVPVIWDTAQQKYVKCDPNDPGVHCFHVRCVDCGHVLTHNQYIRQFDHRNGLNKGGRKCKKKQSANARVIIRHRPYG
jgi:hypothetical protein